MPLKGIPLSQPSFLFPGGRLRVEKRVRTENGLAWSNFSLLAEFRRGASACNDHRPFDGVPLVGINLDGSSLRDGFSANIPGNLRDSVLGDGEVVGGTAETQHAVSGTGDAVDVPLAVFGNLDLGIVGLFRNNGPGFGGHGMDAAGGEIQRLGRTVRLDNFSECGVASGANIIAGIRTGLEGLLSLVGGTLLELEDSQGRAVPRGGPVSYTHLTLPTT